MANSVPFTDLRYAQFHPLGRCMYCGATEKLTREHIVPFGLGGPGVLPDSSCGDCAVITSKFEREVLRGNFLGLRACLNLKTRRPTNRPLKLPLTVIKGGEEEEILVPVLEHPILVSFPIFHPPRVGTGDTGEGVRFRYLAIFNFGKPIDQVKAAFGADDIRVSESSRPVAFARMLAKIAWGFGIVHGQEDRMSPKLLDAILYSPNRIGDWVGTYTGPLTSSLDVGGHMVEIREDHDKGLLLAGVQLFAGNQTPKYCVVLGKL